MDTAVLEGRDLSLAFGATPALRGLTISVAAGESVAIVGASGSGKSTLLHCLAGIRRPTSGSVWFGGGRIDDARDRLLSDLRLRRFGFVFQHSELLPELTLQENVALPLRLADLKRKPALALAGTALERFAIGELAGRRPAEVSGGQLQRAAIARSVVHRPDVVFADEPTGALDSESSERVLDALYDVDLRQGASLVIVTHEDRVAARADRVVRVTDGLVEDTDT